MMARICKTAINNLKAEGLNVGLFRPITVKPFPYDACKAALAKAKRAISIEMNMGQMIQDIKLAGEGVVDIDFFGKAGGLIPSIEEVTDEIRNCLKKIKG